MTNPVGRKPKFKTVKALRDAIDAYFAECAESKDILTISGLAYALGMSTEALRNYESKPQFLATIKRAKLFVEISWEKNLIQSGGSGPIFWLKNNAGWKDKTEQKVEASVQVTGIDWNPVAPTD